MPETFRTLKKNKKDFTTETEGDTEKRLFDVGHLFHETVIDVVGDALAQREEFFGLNFLPWVWRQARSELGRSAERSPMQAWCEFGFSRRRIRKSKASPVQMRRRRLKRYTCVCARAATVQMNRNRRRLLRTKFVPHSEGSINNIGLPRRLPHLWQSGPLPRSGATGRSASVVTRRA